VKWLVVFVAALAPVAHAEPTAPEWRDTPAWSDASKDKRIRLLWDIGPDRKNPHDPYGDGFGLPLHPVDVVLELGGVTRRIKLPPETGGLGAYNQVICHKDGGPYPLAPNEVAKLTFYEGGASGYAVVRNAQDVLEIHHWSQTDGACDGPNHTMVACPISDQLVTRFHIPQDAKTVGSAVFVTRDGKQSKIVCGDLDNRYF